jgi:hypothetical protein
MKQRVYYSTRDNSRPLHFLQELIARKNFHRIHVIQNFDLISAYYYHLSFLALTLGTDKRSLKLSSLHLGFRLREFGYSRLNLA